MSSKKEELAGAVGRCVDLGVQGVALEGYDGPDVRSSGRVGNGGVDGPGSKISTLTTLICSSSSSESWVTVSEGALDDWGNRGSDNDACRVSILSRWREKLDPLEADEILGSESVESKDGRILGRCEEESLASKNAEGACERSLLRESAEFDREDPEVPVLAREGA